MRPGRQAVLAALAVASVAVALYARTASFGFAFDDVSEVVRNEYVRSLAHLPQIFSSGAWDGAGEHNAIYRPLTTATYALNYAAGGLSPAGYHVVNVVLHAAVCVLVLLLGLRLGLSPWASGLAAALFAVHPVHVEVVANIAGRKDLLAGGFVLLGVLAHALSRRRAGKAWTLVAPVSVAAALFSKESGAAVLVLVVLWDALFEKGVWSRRPRRALALYAVYAAEFGLYLWARYAAVGSLGVPLDKIPYAENPAAHAPALVRVLTALAVLGRGLLLTLFPHRLSPDYSYDAIPLATGLLSGGVLASALVLAALAAGAFLCRRRCPAATYAVAWYFVAVFPASNLLIPVGTILGERLLYLPSAGFCLAVAWGLERVWSRRRAPYLAAAVAVAMVALSARTVSYSAVWADEVSLFRAAVEAEPNSGKAHQLLGEALMEEGDVPEGARELQTAVAILAGTPEYPLGQTIELGVAYERLQRWAEAADSYRRVLERKPGDPDALWRLGVVSWSQGRRGEAVQLWEQVVSVAPDHARALSDLGLAASVAGDPLRAEALWLRSVAADPRIAGPWMWLGDLYASRGDLGRARAAWTRFLENARYGVFVREREVVAERLRRTDPSAAGMGLRR